jgi:type IV secretory pathway VirB2 component (pilin)
VASDDLLCLTSCVAQSLVACSPCATLVALQGPVARSLALAGCVAFAWAACSELGLEEDVGDD